MKKILFSIAGMLCFCYGTRAVNLNLNLTGNTQIGLIVIKNDTSLNIYMGGNTYFIAEIYYSVSQPGAINIYGTGSLTIAKITTQGTTNKHANSVGTINLYGKATLKIGDIKLSDGEHYKEAANSNGKIPGYCYCEPAHKGQCGSCKCNISSYESKKSIERGGNAACGGIYNIYDGSIMFENRITGGKGGDDAEFFMTATCAGLASIYIYPGDINPHGANHLAIVNILGGGNEEVKTSGLQITPSLNGHTEAKGGGNGGNIGYNDITLGRNNFPMTFNSCYDSTWSNVIVQSGWDKYAHNSRIGYTLTGYRTLNAPNDTTLTKCNNGALPFVKANNHVSSSDFGVTAICPNNTCDGVSLFAQWKANVYVIEFKPYAIARYGSQSPEYIGKDSAEYDSPMRRIDASGRTYLIPKGSDYTFEGHFSMLKQQQYTGKTYEGYTFAGYYADTVKISHENEMWTGHPDTIIKKGRQYYTPTMTSARIWDIPDNHPLYAHWIANKYHIELNKQGGSGGSDTALFTYDSAYTIPAALTAPTRTGYTFKGYYNQRYGVKNALKYLNSNMTMARKWDKPSGDTLFAYWEANPYVITLVSEGSGITSQGTTSVTTYYDRHLPPGAMPPEKTGYVFKGYFTERNGAGIQYYNGTTPMTSMRVWATNGNAVLYAHFVNETVNRIDFDKQGGAGGTNYLWIKYQDPMPNAQAPTKTGYNFTGYYDAASGGVQYYDGSMQAGGLWDKPAASTILYARWQPAVYTITLKQCNVAAAVTIAATYDAMLPTISAAAPQRTGYTFDGYWNDSIGGTKFYNADRTAAITPNKWTIDSNYVLYAHWIPVQKTITINAAESTIPSQTLTVAYDQPYPAMTNIPVLNGYELMGFWNTQNPTGGVQYYRADGTPLFEKYTINGNLQLYARWRYSVVYLANGGSGVIADTTMCIKGIAQQLHGGSGVMRTGYTLSGWALLPNASAKEWSLSESVSAMRSLAPNYAPTMRTLYAVWTAGGTIITFDRQQGTDGTERTSALYQNQIPDIVPPVRTGYDFAGYYSGANGTGTQYYAANGAGIGLWTMTDQTKTLYAKWTPASFMVILDKQNGIAPDTISVIYNSPMPAGIAAPTYAQHTFAGYWDVPVSYGAMYYTEAMAGNQPFNKTTNTTLYARWIAHESTILLYPEGGSGGDQSVRVEYGQPMPSGLTPPSRDGYIFDGYWAYYPSTIQFYDANMNSTSNWNGCCSELYAKWIPQRYNIAYRCNYSGCNTDSMRSVLYNSYISKHPRIERAGFSLRGWSLNPNTDPSDYDAMKYDGWFYEYPADTTLYAVWDTGAFWVDFYLACNTAKTTDVPNMQIFLYSKRIDFLPTTAHCYGHNFEGWYYPDANGRRYQAGDTYDMSQNASFVAKWSAAQPYTMTLIASPVGHVNGADSAGIVVYKNSRVEALPAARCDTAIFDGWYDLPQNALTDGTQSRKWSDTTIYPYERSHIAYAHWLPMEDAGRVDVIPPIQIIVDSSTRVSQRYYITNDCDAKSADVHFLLPPDVKLYYNGDSARDIKLPLPTPDIYVLRYTLKLGYTSVNDSIVIERRLNPQKIIVQKRGILIVNDNYEQNGGYKFSAYQWYRDTMPIAGATHQYFYEGMDSGAAGALRHDVKYSVLLTTIAGKRHFTCPEYARTGAVKQMSVYPNPAEQGAYINIALPSDENIARIEIFSLSGALIRTHETTPAAVQQFMVDMPPGLYIIKAGSSTSTMTVK